MQFLSAGKEARAKPREKAKAKPERLILPKCSVQVGGPTAPLAAPARECVHASSPVQSGGRRRGRGGGPVPSPLCPARAAAPLSFGRPWGGAGGHGPQAGLPPAVSPGSQTRGSGPQPWAPGPGGPRASEGRALALLSRVVLAAATALVTGRPGRFSRHVPVPSEPPGGLGAKAGPSESELPCGGSDRAGGPRSARACGDPGLLAQPPPPLRSRLLSRPAPCGLAAGGPRGMRWPCVAPSRPSGVAGAGTPAPE